MFSYAKLILASLNPRRSSLRTLQDMLDSACETEFGRKYGFDAILDAGNAEEILEKYRSAVPPMEYEDFRPYVNEYLDNRTNVLFDGRPEMYATTSGTTSESKMIPISSYYIQAVHKVLDYLWVQDIIHRRPLVLLGKVFAISSKATEGMADDGVPYGSVSGMLKDRMSHFVSKRYVIPSVVYSIKDYNARYYTLMRIAMERQVTSILTANPSTFIELIRVAQENFPQIIEDIENGTISCSGIEPEILEKLHFRKRPLRAAVLRRLYNKYGTEILPKHYWPFIQYVGTWRCGNTAIFQDMLKEAFPKFARIQDCGYFASECRMGLALRSNVNSVIFPHLNFYEFVHESELDSPDKHFLLADELVCGERYCPYITTWSGLYRYNMNDLVEAGPRFLGTPTLRMVQKINGIVSITGEKLYESQFVDAVNALYSGFAFFIGIANISAQRYDFFFEPGPGGMPGNMDSFAQALDIELKYRNPEYRAKRDSLRLDPARCHCAPQGTAREYRHYLISRGRRDGQLKHILLVQDDSLLEYFTSLCK